MGNILHVDTDTGRVTYGTGTVTGRPPKISYTLTALDHARMPYTSS